MKYEIHVDQIPEESFALVVREAASRNCLGSTPQWVTDAVADGVEVFLEDVMMQAAQHFADRINGDAVTGGTPRQNSMAVAWTIGSMVRPHIIGGRLKVVDPIDPDVKRLCSEIYGVGLGLELLRACNVIEDRTIRKISDRFDFEACGPNGSSFTQIEVKGTFNSVSSSRHRKSIAETPEDFGQRKSYDRAVGIIASLCEPINPCVPIILGSHPSHNAEAANIVDVQRLKAIEAKILKVHPGTAVRIARQIPFTGFASFIVRYKKHITNKRCPSGAKRIAVAALSHKETGPVVRLNVLGMHSHIADQKNRSPCLIDRIGHERTERIS
jgi:hypothetical protein